MNRFICKNIILFLLASIAYGNFPTSDAGEDISEIVTSCTDKNTIISVNGSSSTLPGLGICDTGVCLDALTGNELRYCTTSIGASDDECLIQSDCGDYKFCEGGEKDGEECTSEADGYCGAGLCEFAIKCLPLYSHELYCEGDWNNDGNPDGVWEANYEDINESECDAYGDEKNHKWYDYSLSYNWESSSDHLEIVNSTDVISDIIFNPLSSSEVQVDTVYLLVTNTFADTTFADTSQLLINLDPQLPCAIASDDIHLCRACADLNSPLYNSNYVDNVLSVIEFSQDSYSNSGSDFSYSWIAPDGFTFSNSNIASPQLLIGSETNNYANFKKSIHIFTLEVTDNTSGLVSVPDTLIIYMNPSRPKAPKVEVYPQNDKITLNWSNENSLFSTDSLSGYSDFEGYRIYKSNDGGNTWGSADDRIFYNGEHVGWRHEDQSDLSETQDSNFCIKGINTSVIGEDLEYQTWADCVAVEVNPESCCNNPESYDGEVVRGISISNLDPYAPWINLGDDRGLNFSYVDTSVYNGKEYTYAVVAYDIGLQSYANETSATGVGICVLCDDSDSVTNTEEECCLLNEGVWDDGEGVCIDSCEELGHIWTATYEYVPTWPATNPDQFTYDGVNGYRSLESEYDVGMIAGTKYFDSDGKGNPGWIIEKYDYNSDQDMLDILFESLLDQDYCGLDDMDSFGSWADGAKNDTCYEYINIENVVTAVPAFYADNVELISDFLDEDKDFGIPAYNKLWSDTTEFSIDAVGNGGVYFQIINPYNITDKKYKFQIQADYAGSDVEIFEGYKTESPKLYAWEVNELNEEIGYIPSYPLAYDYSITSQDQLTHDEKCELLNLPGSYIEGECSRWTKVCEEGNKDGKECTYDEDYCTGGLCVDAAVNYLTDYYSCVCDDIQADLSGASGSLDGLADNYNDWLFGGDTIFYPFYEIEDFSVKYLYEDGYDENYTDFLDGLKFIFNNNVEKVEDLEGGKVKVNTLQSFNADSVETSLSDYIDITLEYGNGGNVFENKPSYSYRIELTDTPQFPASIVTPSSGCSGDRPNTLLPFKVINTTTGLEVGVNHVDKGGFYDESGEYNAFGTCVEDGNPCSQNQYCDINECVELKGYGDCAWEKNERTSFTQDLVHVGLTTTATPEYTFDLKINYRVYALYSKGIDPSQIDQWSLGQVYETGDIVKYNDMFWEAMSSSNALVNPVQWVDDGNGGNDSVWKPVYPWEDGDYIIIEPTRWYVDGDNWIADLSSLGKDGDVTEKSLENISVVPNPYLVYSDYDETPTERRLWFNHLPTKCRITIYTITGERVASMLHDDELSGKKSWNLQRPDGKLVAPGLYIYTVESEGTNSDGEYGYIKYISKFAIVR